MSGGRVLVCADLDRTLIYSPSALALPGPDETAPRLVCVEVYRSAPLSFITERAATLIRQLAREAVLVPTTTRTPEQLARVHLPGLDPDDPASTGTTRYAIAGNGGQLLVDGVPDPDWAREVAERVGGCAPVSEVFGYLSTVSGPFVHSLRVACDLFVYAVVDRGALPPTWEPQLRDFCRARGWGVSVQGRKVYAVPAPLTKQAAMREVASRTGARSTLAAGDSLLDRELLEVADAAVRPVDGELATVAWSPPGLHVTASPGVLGGEEVVEWLLQQVRQSVRTSSVSTDEAPKTATLDEVRP
jgi:hypothetical protein